MVIVYQEILFLLQPTDDLEYIISIDDVGIIMKTEIIESAVPLRDSLKKEYDRSEVVGFTVYAEKFLFEERPEILTLLRADFDAVRSYLQRFSPL
jgi:hypothetical protein